MIWASYQSYLEKYKEPSEASVYIPLDERILKTEKLDAPTYLREQNLATEIQFCI
jgi:hypothetical protein